MDNHCNGVVTATVSLFCKFNGNVSSHVFSDIVIPFQTDLTSALSFAENYAKCLFCNDLDLDENAIEIYDVMVFFKKSHQSAEDLWYLP